jgi:hypothetical protein
MPRKHPKSEPVADTQAEQGPIVYPEERAGQPRDAPLTADELMRAAGDCAVVATARIGLRPDPASAWSAALWGWPPSPRAPG